MTLLRLARLFFIFKTKRSCMSRKCTLLILFTCFRIGKYVKVKSSKQQYFYLFYFCCLSDRVPEPLSQAISNETVKSHRKVRLFILKACIWRFIKIFNNFIPTLFYQTMKLYFSNNVIIYLYFDYNHYVMGLEVITLSAFLAIRIFHL